MRTFRRRAAWAVLIGLAALVAIGLGIGVKHSGRYQWTTAPDLAQAVTRVDFKVIGDTLSIVSGAAFDTVFSSTYDCCHTYATKNLDTTRAALVLGANRVVFKVMAGDTATGALIRVSGVQISDDSTNWMSLTVPKDASYHVLVDTTAVSFAALVGNFTPANSGGGGRSITVTPQQAVAAATDWLLAPAAHIDFKFMRLILQRTKDAVVPNYPAYSNRFRVRTYVERDDMGDALLRTRQGR